MRCTNHNNLSTTLYYPWRGK